MVDFAKLRDPEYVAQLAREREAEELALETKIKSQKKAAQVCAENIELMSEKERSFVRNVRMALSTYRALTPAQEKWLMDLAMRFEPQSY